MSKTDIIFFLFIFAFILISFVLVGSTYYIQTQIDGFKKKEDVINYITENPFKTKDNLANIVGVFCRKVIELKVPYNEIEKQTKGYCLEYYAKKYERQKQKELIKNLFNKE